MKIPVEFPSCVARIGAGVYFQREMQVVDGFDLKEEKRRSVAMAA